MYTYFLWVRAKSQRLKIRRYKWNMGLHFSTLIVDHELRIATRLVTPGETFELFDFE